MDMDINKIKTLYKYITANTTAKWQYAAPTHLYHIYLNHEGRWGTTDDFCNQFPPFFLVLHCPLGLGRLQACPFPDVVFQRLPLSALSSSPFHCALQGGFGQT